MNAVISNILQRSSIRGYTQDEIPEDDICSMIECARWAPSGSNTQPWRFIVIRSEKIKNKLTSIVTNGFDAFWNSLPDVEGKESVLGYRKYLEFMQSAPVLIAVLGKPYESLLTKMISSLNVEQHWNIHGADPATLSIGAAIQNILLCAESLGYGSCWLTGPLMFQEQLESYLEVTEPWHLVSFITVGRPLQRKPRSQVHRKPLDEILTFMPEPGEQQ
ncbi:MAG: nitroreductase family protein [Candidatus Auribacter fodinae]|jgi:nitroreductase|uniref:Nitroreductase family protein n=1 Tax=Candidatus Auribacter fodinae TaxID=2093366 RepID=A0A3A4QU77_9BACT|nr:MAG: nitroreductase family protein [Candidatus Auribacter fodinae]